MKSSVRNAATVGCIVIAAATTACGGESTAPVRGDVASVTLAPSDATLGVGSSAPFDAVVISTVGDTMPATGLSWSSSDASVARVSSSGVVTAVAVGSATIAATVKGRSAIAKVSVVPTAVASVQVSPLELQLVEGGQGTVTARILDAQGRTLSGRAVQWQSSNASVATVSSSGLVTGVGAGNATIVASSEGRSASMAVAVSPVAVATVSLSPSSASLAVGATRQFQAEVRDASGAMLPGRPVSWTTTTPTVVSVSSTGVVVGVSPGTGQITASSGGRSASASITVEAPPPPVVVGRVTVSPPSATLKSSGTTDRTVQLSATAFRNDNGNWVAVPNATFTWTTSNPNIAVVTSSGLVSSVAPGRVTIIATSGSQLGTSEITVEAPPPPPVVVQRVTVTPTTVTLKSSGSTDRTAQLSASAFTRDGNGNFVLLPNAPFTWTSSNPGVASVSSSGQVTGLSTGRTTITVTSGGQSATAEITVEAPTPPPNTVGRVTVSPSSATIRFQGNTNRSVQLVARAYRLDDDDWELIPNATFTWTSSNPAVASVTSTGLVTGLSEGRVTITATSGSQLGTADITVERR